MSFWQRYKPFILNLAATLALAGLGVLLSGDYSSLYTRLDKPPLAPPGWLFPVAWSILYILMGIAAGLVSLLIYGYYYVMSKKRFGGITGDLAGYFLCLCELGILLTTVLMGRMGA